LFTSRSVSILINVTTEKPEKLPNDGLTICIDIYYGKRALSFIKERNFERFKRGWKTRGSTPSKSKRH
jgi:hypothetical protein